MTTLTLNPEAIAQLRKAAKGAVICDEDGNIVGQFLPPEIRGDVDPFDCPISDDEIRQRAGSTAGRPLSEILKDFEARS